MIQIAIFNLGPGDPQAVEEMNRFLRGHRVLTIDKGPIKGVKPHFSHCRPIPRIEA